MYLRGAQNLEIRVCMDLPEAVLDPTHPHLPADVLVTLLSSFWYWKNSPLQ